MAIIGLQQLVSMHLLKTRFQFENDSSCFGFGGDQYLVEGDRQP